jgi:hypothetical protein
LAGGQFGLVLWIDIWQGLAAVIERIGVLAEALVVVVEAELRVSSRVQRLQLVGPMIA